MWISKKELNCLNSVLNAEKERANHWENKYLSDSIEIKKKASENIAFREKFYREQYKKKIEEIKKITNEINSLNNEINSLNMEIKHYKQIYLDELQKRLELANRVRELEEKQNEQT